MIYRIFSTYSPLLILGMLGIWLLLPDMAFAQALEAAESSIKALLYFIVISVFGWLLGVAGFLLDFAIENFIINFGTTFNTQGVGVAVDALWVTVRDMFNIIFIFGLVYLGFKMILNSDDSGTQQALVYLIMAALLVNFSLFITKFVVDFTNVLAREVAVAGFQASPDVGRTVDISNTFFSYMGVAETLDLPDNMRDEVSQSWSFIFGNALIYLIGMFVFASGAIMIIIRFVALSIYMVLSPFMFLGWVFPGFRGVTSRYWRGFLGRAFYAPVYIVLIYFAAFILHNMFGAGGAAGPGWGVIPSNGSVAGYESFGTIIAPFLLSSAFLIAAVQVAGKLSADGAGTVMKVGNNIVRGGQRRLQRGAAGAALYVPRRGAQNAAALGGSGVSGATRLARRTRLGRWATNNTTGQALLNARNTSRQAKFGASTTMRQRDVAKSAMESQSKREVSLRDADKIKRDIKKSGKKMQDSTPEEQEKMQATLAAAERAANDYSPKAIEAMTAAQRAQITPYLKAGTVVKLLESDELSSAEKGQIHSDYSSTIHDKIVENGQVVTDEITKLSVKQLEILGDQFVRDYAGFFAEGQMDDLKKSDQFTETQKGAHKGARKQMLEVFGKNGKVQVTDPRNSGGKLTISEGDTRKYLFSETKRDDKTGEFVTGKALKAVELAARPLNTYIDKSNGKIRDDARRLLTADVLKQIARNSQQGKPTMSDDERQKLAQAVVNTPDMNIRAYSYLTKEKTGEDFFMTKEMKGDAEKQVEYIKDPDKAIRDALDGETLGM